MKTYARPFEDDRDNDRGGGRNSNAPSMAGDDPLGLRRRGKRKKPPAFVLETDFHFDYKNPQQLKFFITERGKVVPRRISGLTAKQQRELTVAIKRARQIALMPFTATE
jgi:small subunit ribosomal protein S18